MPWGRFEPLPLIFSKFNGTVRSAVWQLLLVCHRFRAVIARDVAMVIVGFVCTRNGWSDSALDETNTDDFFQLFS